ncbi:MAG: c-type cytochrome [Polaromonas sp.]|nr:c-type cytochrome [Polaromonas sp.]
MKIAVALTTTAVLGACAAIVGAAVVFSGVYDISASRQHTQTVYSLLETTMHHSVQRRARQITPPPLDDPQRIARGAALFHDKCVQCHGAPGVSQDDIGKSMQPVPGPLVDALQRWRPREIYWITRHGIKMSGMPAWEFRLEDSQLWDITAFIVHLPTLTPAAYADITRRAGETASPSPATSPHATASTVAPSTIGSVERGKQALYQYACNACHTIPGVTGSAASVGPPLVGIARRGLIAGRLANTPDNMMEWIRHPQKFKPQTAMPDLGVTEPHARDMAAYLATLR